MGEGLSRECEEHSVGILRHHQHTELRKVLEDSDNVAQTSTSRISKLNVIKNIIIMVDSLLPLLQTGKNAEVTD